MTDNEKLEAIAEIMDLDASEISPEMKLADLDSWDSVALLSFIAMMDEKFNKEVKGAVIRQFVTVQDAMDIMKE